ncbi:MAG TPA: tetratricopeptide repeat protein [Blastocatellia bacterium]|nr:tetratricopeptide repeat protein [Blastocatellia bacterium]
MATSRKAKKRSGTISRLSAQKGKAAESTRIERGKQAGAKPKRRAREFILVGAVLVVTLLAYVNSLDGEFVYDDQMQVLQNPTIKSLSLIPRMIVGSVWQFMSQGPGAAVGPYYRPLFNIALIINYHLFGFEVLGWHFVSVLFHLGVTFLLYVLARRYGLSPMGSAVAAAVFGIHPVHSESVAWISGIPDPMAAVFILGSILAYERWRERSEHSWPLLALAVGLSFLAMLSKEIGIALPVFIVVRELFGGDKSESLSSLSRRASVRAWPFLVPTVAYLVMRYLVLGSLAQDGPNAAGIPFTHVLLTIPAVLMTYARLLIVPYPLSIVYDQTFVESASDPRFWLSAIGVLIVTGSAILLARRNVVAVRALALLILFLLPVLNLKTFRPEESLLHDRYLYVPSIGFSLLIALGVVWVAGRWGDQIGRFAFVVLGIIAVVLLGLTVIQNQTWQNEAAMTSHALAVFPRWPFMHNYLGARHYFSRNLPQAEKEFEEAIRCRPNYADAHSNLGDVLSAQGRLAEAELSYLKSIEYGVKYADTRYNLGVIYLNTNRLAAAEKAFVEALDIEPRHERARYNLGYVYEKQNRLADAVAAYLKTIEYNPAYPEPRITLAAILIRKGQYNEAIDQLRTAARYAQDNPSLLYQLGDAYRLAGRFDEAITVLNQLQARQPQHPLVYTTLGLSYEAAGRKDQAKVYFERAIQVAPTEPMTGIAREHLAKL